LCFKAEASSLGDSATRQVAGVATDFKTVGAHLAEGHPSESLNRFGGVAVSLHGASAPVADLEFRYAPVALMEASTENERIRRPKEGEHWKILPCPEGGLAPFEEGSGLVE
jgi:hypothetical protein